MFIKRLTGSRLHCFYFRLFKVKFLFSVELLDDIQLFLFNCLLKLDDCYDICLSIIFRVRLSMIFILLVDDLLLFSFNNILFRSLGISWYLHFDYNYYLVYCFIFVILCLEILLIEY